MNTEPNSEFSSDTLGPWNPGITSQLTPKLWRGCTIFREDNVFTTYEQAVEFHGLTGLPLPQLVVFKPARLVLHALLVRVAADYETPDPEGASVPSLGINFRRMTQAILGQHLLPHIESIKEEYGTLRESIATIVKRELAVAFGHPVASTVASSSRPRWLRWLGRPRRAADSSDDDTYINSIEDLMRSWQAQATSDSKSKAIYGTLIRIVSAIRGVNGQLWGNPELLEPLVTGLACNEYAGDMIGNGIEPLIVAAARAEGFRSLPPQAHPVILSTKGASAAGKSSMRSMQRSLATRMGESWSDFALISPDIFRRDLLDIESLGNDERYFGTFTSHELEIVDRKLDRYLAHKATLGTTPHMLVDRFRFDSFAPDSEEQREVLARLGKPRLISYVFMITPPEETVERAWKRGLQIGRYKAIDDLLAHNVDAYSGMQTFFLTRALQSTGLKQHYEFLDNGVPYGEVPLCVAFGWNGEFNVLDVNALVDIDRYRRINVEARTPKDLYADTRSATVNDNVAFLVTCIRRFPVLMLAVRSTGRVYARFEKGRLVGKDSAVLAAITDPTTLATLRAVAPDLFTGETSVKPFSDILLDPANFLTLGRWGSAQDGALP